MTFAELSAQLEKNGFQRTVFKKLIEILDDQFLPGHDGNPKFVLLDERKVRVPVDVIDDVAKLLTDLMKALDAETENLSKTEIELKSEESVATTQVGGQA